MLNPVYEAGVLYNMYVYIVYEVLLDVYAVQHVVHEVYYPVYDMFRYYSMKYGIRYLSFLY